MKLVCDFLLTEGTTWEDLSTSEKKLFEKVVPVIMDRRRGLEEADSLRRANAINQSSIAAAVNVSRKTLCTNNRIVANFIEKYSSGEQKTDIKAERYAHLQAELAEVRGRLDKVLDQEIIAQNYAAELHLAEDRINQKDIQIHNLENENASLRAELDKYRRIAIDEAVKDNNLKVISQFASGTKHKN